MAIRVPISSKSGHILHCAAGPTLIKFLTFPFYCFFNFSTWVYFWAESRDSCIIEQVSKFDKIFFSKSKTWFHHDIGFKMSNINFFVYKFMVRSWLFKRNVKLFTLHSVQPVSSITTKAFLFKLDPLSQWEFLRVVDCASWSPHVLFPCVRSRLPSSPSGFLTTEGASDLRARSRNVHVDKTTVRALRPDPLEQIAHVLWKDKII